MKQQLKIRDVLYALCFASIAFVACNKNEAALPTTNTAGSNSSNASTEAGFAVVASASIATTDSVIIVQPCLHGAHRDSVAQTDLPAAIGTYLNATYSGYTFHKAFAIEDSLDNLTGYAVVVYYNDKPVGLEFDAAGTFVKVLEQREKGDDSGRGGHGGRFQHRDGKGRDTVALSALPASVLSYFAATYSSDTLLKAYKGVDSSVVVLSKNNGIYATVFDAAGVFIKRSLLPNPKHGLEQPIDQSALPSAVTSYLSTTYPAYVFKKAFVIKDAGAVKGYIVVIDANNTKYAVAFDGSGAFVEAKTIY